MKEKECPACMKKVIPISKRVIIRRGSLMNIYETILVCPECEERMS